jgi:hypothetical protein
MGLEFLDPSKDFSDSVPQDEPIEIQIWKLLTIKLYSTPEGNNVSLI